MVDLDHDIIATTGAMSSTQALIPLSPISLCEHKDGSGIHFIDESTRPTYEPSPISSAFVTLDPDAFLIPPPPHVSSTHTSATLSLPIFHPWATTNYSSKNISMACSVASSLTDEVPSPGDVVGEGIQLHGEDSRLLSVHSIAQFEPPALELEVIKRLNTGSCAIIYLVREVLSRFSFESMDSSDTVTSRVSVKYGRDIMIKCLAKANLDAGALAAQMAEVTIHQSLRLHPNISTLHRTLETSFLLLLLEYVPVAACHDWQVFHRDIKPENFIVMDVLPDGSRECKRLLSNSWILGCLLPIWNHPTRIMAVHRTRAMV
ncbi:hypothetical protein PILCRDRAFT_326687 [Piloderma croceum F 1598]|uniref:Protein kinase domain-containing protein n=1 Tax=Piloderma croceum (strain F 1598) TaxID=765440 RepID=A0A0C3G708_PILCF|nr:hypothetical protein PILCRDRAFT_326687 [Piloderma croceum F 1598]